MRIITTIFLITITFLGSYGQSANQDEAFYKNGIELLDNNNYSAAIYYFNKAVALNPNVSIYYHNRGYAKQMTNDLEGALIDYKLASKLVPTESLYYYLIATVYTEQHNYSEAITNYTTAIELDPTDYLYYFNRGNLLLKLEDFNNALSDYNVTLKNNSNHYGAYNNRAIAKFKLNNIDGACNDWTKAKENGLDKSSIYIEKYCSGVKSNSINEEFNVVEKESNNNQDVSILPSFYYNGIDNFRTFIQMNLRYPIEAHLNKEQGKVMVKFYVMKDGSIDSVRIINSVTKTLDAEALRIIKLSEGHWRPGMFLGKPVETPMTMPIVFTYGLDGISNIEVTKNQKSNNEIIYAGGTNNYNFDYKKIYYDSIWQVTIPEKASYYRIAQWDPFNKFFHGNYKDYDINNTLIGEGKYYNNLKHDTMLIYYPTGQIKCKGFYLKGNPNNEWYYYYENGKLWQKIVFTKNSFYVDTFIDSSGNILVKEGTGSWNMKFLDGNKEFEIVYTGNFKNGKRKGLWCMYHNNVKIVEEVYRNGNFVKGSIYDPENRKMVRAYMQNLRSDIFNPIHLNCSEELTFDSITTNANYKFQIK